MNLYDIISKEQLSITLDKSTKLNIVLGESSTHDIMEAELDQRLIFNLFKEIARIINHSVTEGVWDSIKRGAGKLVQKAGDVASNAGYEMSRGVTANKLSKAWAQAGSPTNSNNIAKFLYNKKIPIEVIKQSFNSLNIPLPFKSKDSTASAGNNAFSQMTSQLGNTSTISTGGEVTKTPTGIKYTSKQNLPIKKLEKNWIEYLKSSQIVQLKSDPEIGKLAYKRPVKLDDVTRFLSSEGYEDEQIETALSFVKLTGKPASAPAAPAAPAAATAASSTTTPPATKGRGGRKPGAAPSQTPDAIRKRQARQKKKAGVTEDFTDKPVEVSEKDVEKIFAELLKSKPVSENAKQLDRILQLAGIYKPVNNSF